MAKVRKRNFKKFKSLLQYSCFFYEAEEMYFINKDSVFCFSMNVIKINELQSVEKAKCLEKE